MNFKHYRDETHDEKQYRLSVQKWIMACVLSPLSIIFFLFLFNVFMGKMNV